MHLDGSKTLDADVAHTLLAPIPYVAWHALAINVDI